MYEPFSDAPNYRFECLSKIEVDRLPKFREHSVVLWDEGVPSARPHSEGIFVAKQSRVHHLPRTKSTRPGPTKTTYLRVRSQVKWHFQEACWWKRFAKRSK